MARYVKLTVVYDMDDAEKTLGAEYADWRAGNVGLGDFASNEWELVEISEAEAQEWLGHDPEFTQS